MRPRNLRLPSGQTIALCCSIAVLAVAMSVTYPGFSTAGNLEVLATGFILEGFMAVGMTPVIVAGGIDLSVGAVLPFAAIVAASLLKSGAPVPAAVPAALAAAALIGALNGGLILLLRVHPFIVTLGTMLTIKGINLVITHGAPIAGLPPAFAGLGQGRLLGVPVPIVIFGAVALAIGVLMRHHRFWQQVYLVGDNPRAARTAGVRVGRVTLLVYVVSALLAGAAGVIAASSFGSASAGFGQNAELRVITAVVIGGASLYGGTGSIGGTVLGVLFLAILYNAFATTGVSTYWQDVVTGGMVLISVLATELVLRRRTAAA
jgi:ribose transport system permease protein